MESAPSGTGDNGGGFPSNEKVVRLTLQRVSVSPHGSWHEGHFAFSNNTSNPVIVPGFYGAPPRQGTFQPNHVEYQVEKDGRWKALDVAYDGIPQEFKFAPNARATFIISLGPFEQQDTRRDAKLRVRVGAYVSDSFVLENFEQQ